MMIGPAGAGCCLTGGVGFFGGVHAVSFLVVAAACCEMKQLYLCRKTKKSSKATFKTHEKVK